MAAGEDIHVDVYDVEGELITELDVPPRATVHYLKSMLSDLCNVPALCQHLTSKGKVLEDSDYIEVVYLQGRNRHLMMDVTLVKSFETLTGFLANENEILREGTVKVLGNLSHQDHDYAFETAVGRLEDGDAAVRRAAVDSLLNQALELSREKKVEELAEHNKNCIKLYAARLADTSEEVRQAACHALLFTAKGEKSAITATKKLLKHWNKGVRVAAVRTLSTIANKSDEDVVNALCDCFRDADSEVRHEASRALHQVGQRLAVQKLGRLCGDASKAMGESRRLAIESLPAMLHPSANDGTEAPEACEDAIAAVTSCLRDPLPEIRIAAVECLARVAPARHDNSLIALCGQLGVLRAPRPKTPDPDADSSEEEEEEELSSESDGEGGRRKKKKEPPKPPPIIIPPCDTDPRVRKAAIEALTQVAPQDDPMVFDILIERLHEPALEVRRAVETALLEKFAKKDDQRLVPMLVNLTMHDTADVRFRAVQMLQAIVSQGELYPAYVEVQQQTGDDPEAAEQFVLIHDEKIELVRQKLEECRKKPKTAKTDKAKRMFKATLLRLENNPKYISQKEALVQAEKDALESFIAAHKAKIAEAEAALKRAKKRAEKVMLKEMIQALQEDQEYLDAVRELYGPTEEELQWEAMKAELAATAPQDLPEGAAPRVASKPEPVEEEEIEPSDDEGLEEEDVYEIYLADSDDEEEQRKRQEPPPSPRPAGPVTALVYRMQKEDNCEVLRATMEALAVVAPSDRPDVLEALRPHLMHPVAEIRQLAVSLLSAKSRRLSEQDRKAIELRIQDREACVRDVARKALDK